MIKNHALKTVKTLACRRCFYAGAGVLTGGPWCDQARYHRPEGAWPVEGPRFRQKPPSGLFAEWRVSVMAVAVQISQFEQTKNVFNAQDAACAPHPTPADLALAEGSPRPTFTRQQGRFAGMRTRSLQLPCVVCALTGTPKVPSVSGMLPVAVAQGCRVSSIIDQWCTWAHCTGLKFNFGTKAML